jgi:hypothetical protein
MATAFPRSSYFTAALFAAAGLSALVVGFGAKSATMYAGGALLLGVVAVLLRYRAVGFLLGGIAGLFLIGEQLPLALGTREEPSTTTAIGLSLLGLVSAVAAVIGLGPLLGTSGGC